MIVSTIPNAAMLIVFMFYYEYLIEIRNELQVVKKTC